MRHATLATLIAAATLVLVQASHAGPVMGAGARSNAGGGGAGAGNAPDYACGITDVASLASDCLGFITGNDGTAALNTLAGGMAWHGLDLSSLMQFKDDTAGAGSTNALFDAAQSADDASRGRLSFLMDLSGPFVLTLKGGNSWAAYFMADGAAAGSSLLFDIPGRQGQGLSHASIYTAEAPSPTRQIGPPPPNQAVPEPASLALAAAALGLLGPSRLGRRRATAA